MSTEKHHGIVEECDECGGDDTILGEDEDGRSVYYPCPKCNPDEHDKPERPPEVQPIWLTKDFWRYAVSVSDASFTRPTTHITKRVDVLVPFGWRLVSDPEKGVVYTTFWRGGSRLGPREVYEAARKGEHGWKLELI